MECKILDRKQTAVFLKSYYTTNFDEREVKNIDPKELMNWICPDKISFGLNKVNIDGRNLSFFELQNILSPFQTHGEEHSFQCQEQEFVSSSSQLNKHSLKKD